MTYCERCGFANRQGSHYCNACGFRLVSKTVEGDEPLPAWLRQATVAGYLWKGELLPDWLAAVRPFRELYGGGAVVLPPPYEEVVDDVPPPDLQYAVEQVADDNTIFAVDDEEGPLEGDLLLLDDLDLTTATMDDDTTVLSTDFYRWLERAAQAGLGSQPAFDADAVAGAIVEEDEDGESILEVLSAVLQSDDSLDQDVRLGTDEPTTSRVLAQKQSVSADAETAPPLGAQTVDDGVVAESVDPAPDQDSTNSVDIMADPHSVETSAAPTSAVTGSTDGSAPVRPDSELGENGRRFQSAVGYVLEPQSERSGRKARRKRKK